MKRQWQLLPIPPAKQTGGVLSCLLPFLLSLPSPIRSPPSTPLATVSFVFSVKIHVVYNNTCSRQCSRRRQHLLRRGCWWNQTERGWVGVMPSKRDLGLRARCVFTDQDSVLRSRLSSQQHHTHDSSVFPKTGTTHARPTTCIHSHTPHTHTQHTQHMLHLTLTRRTSVEECSTCELKRLRTLLSFSCPCCGLNIPSASLHTPLDGGIRVGNLASRGAQNRKRSCVSQFHGTKT